MGSILRDELDYTMSEGQSIRVKECDGCIGQGNSKAVSITRKEDGFVWTCFRCRDQGQPKFSGFFPDEGASYSEVKALEGRVKKQDSRPEVVCLPEDIRTLIPKAKVFLYNYWFTDHEISKYQITWSPAHQRIIFPVVKYQKYHSNTGEWTTRLTGWAGRKLDELDPENKMGKWHTIRQRDVANLRYTAVPDVWPPIKHVTVVEDILSAIRIAMTGQMAISLITTYFPDELLTLLQGWKVNMWFDEDAFDKACKYQAMLGNRGITSRAILTAEDPKALEPEKIKEQLIWPT
jgi:hypothetical protein